MRRTMKPLTNCPDCNRPLEPATLNKNHRWCSVCAIEFNASGGRVITKAGAKPGEESAPAPQGSPAALASTGPEPSEVSVLHSEVPVTSKTRRFRVAIGTLSFEVADNAMIDVAGMKIVITAL